ncbi:cofactor assembly of complex C subunit B, partial [Crocosphaera watsonii]
MPILSSTFFLTLLLMVGLFFFIRASVKDRTEQVQLISEVPKTSLLEQLKDYFKQRAYNVTSSDAAQDTMTFEGLVR